MFGYVPAIVGEKSEESLVTIENGDEREVRRAWNIYNCCGECSDNKLC